MSLRQSRKQQADISLDEPLGTDRDGNAVSFADLLGTPRTWWRTRCAAV